MGKRRREEKVTEGVSTIVFLITNSYKYV